MRGIIGVVLSACLLAGCGGVEADMDAEPLGTEQPGTHETGEVSAAVLLYCHELDRTACPLAGANPRSCKVSDIGHAVCYCDEGVSYWRCYY
ncbi:hypothetical protein [Archangium lipolyticum]|uniref:hypothetical protein n=1 Tax=Archangium lipolyticum TaxID=2970465 RepID=UPI00214AF534|nr:hypothetical protein [Archangium lipolyticum]